eukprot:2928136-Lingulodinium_polyedra.AAC.1
MGRPHDRLVRARSSWEVQQRGCWRSPRSVLRYDKRARAGMQLGKLSLEVRGRLEALLGRGTGPFAERFGQLSALGCSGSSGSS